MSASSSSTTTSSASSAHDLLVELDQSLTAAVKQQATGGDNSVLGGRTSKLQDAEDSVTAADAAAHSNNTKVTPPASTRPVRDPLTVLQQIEQQQRSTTQNGSTHSLITSLRSIYLTSRRLAQLPVAEQQSVRHEIARIVAHELQQEVDSSDHAVPGSSTQDRVSLASLSQQNADVHSKPALHLTIQLLATIQRSDDLHTDMRSVQLQRHALVLLLDTCIAVNDPQTRHTVVSLILPPILTTLNTNLRLVEYVIPQLTQLLLIEGNQLQSEAQDFDRLSSKTTYDSLIGLLLRSYTTAATTDANHSGSAAPVLPKAPARNARIENINAANTNVQQPDARSNTSSRNSASDIASSARYLQLPATTLPQATSISDLYALTSRVGTVQQTSTATPLSRQELQRLTHESSQRLHHLLPTALLTVAQHLQHVLPIRRLLRALVRYVVESGVETLRGDSKSAASRTLSTDDISKLLPAIAALMCQNCPHPSPSVTIARHTRAPEHIDQRLHCREEQDDELDDDSHLEGEDSHSIEPAFGVFAFFNVEQNTKWFRRFWYVLVLLGLTSAARGAAPSVTAQSLQTIAAHSPPLLLPNYRKPLLTELELALKRTVNDSKSHTTQIARQLQQVTSTSVSTSKLQPSVALFLVALHACESNRARAGSTSVMTSIMHFTGDPVLTQYTDVQPTINAIMDQAFKQYAESHYSNQPSARQQKTLLETTALLLIRSTSRHPAVRQTANKYIRRLMQLCPAVQWSAAMYTLLSLIQALHLTLETALPHIPPHHFDAVLTTELQNTTSPIPFVKPHHLNQRHPIVDLPESHLERESIYKQLRALAQAWFVAAHQHSPAMVYQLVSSYVTLLTIAYTAVESTRDQASNDVDPNGDEVSDSHLHQQFHGPTHRLLHHAGLSLAIDLLQQTNQSTLPAASLAATLVTDQRYGGQLRGLQQTYQRSHRRSSLHRTTERQHQHITFQRYATQHIMHLNSQLLQKLRTVQQPTTSTLIASKASDTDHSALAALHNDLAQLVYLTAAVITHLSQQPAAEAGDTTHQRLNADVLSLIRVLVNTPLAFSTRRAVSIARNAWSQVWQVDGSELAVVLMTFMSQAWQQTITDQRGLFGQLHITKLAQAPDPHPHTHTGAVDGLRGVDDNLYTGDLAASLTTLGEAGIHSEWLEWMNEVLTPSMIGVNRDVIQLLTDLLLASFSTPQLLLQTPPAYHVRLQLISLALTVVQRSIHIVPHTRSYLRSQLYIAALHWYEVPPAWQNGQWETKKVEDIAKLIQKVHQQLQQEKASITTLRSQLQQQLQSQQMYALSPSDDTELLVETWTNCNNVLQLFLLDDAERLYIWHNPLRRASPAITYGPALVALDSMVTSAQKPTTSSWSTYVRTAWQVSPLLALQLANQYIYIPAVDNSIRQLIQANPAAVYHCSDALRYVVTADTVKDKSNQLITQHLPYFTATNLSTALKLLYPPFNTNRNVVEYAMYTLKQHPADRVVFYISQLVQLLRHDKFGLLEAYVQEISMRSIVFSHQFIWIANAELGTVAPVLDKEGNQVPLQLNDYQLGVKSLVASVISSFSGAAKQFYETEFHFFEQVTSISGVLKPLPTKDARKARIRELLEKVEIKDGVYLPINPKLAVKSIITSSGTPMQSAAKVPILVAFKCVEQPVEELYEEAVKEGADGTAHNAKTDTTTSDQLVEQQNNHISDQINDRDDRDKRTTQQQNGYDVATAYNLQASGGQREGILRLNNQGIDRSDSFDTSDDEEDDDEITADKQADSSKAGERNNAIVRRNNNASPNQRQHRRQSSAAVQQHERKQITTACIFKVGDDTRQDALALQVMQLAADIWRAVGLPIHVYPYRVVPTSTGSASDALIGGVIECIPNAATRDEIGKATACSLKQYYMQKFGPESSASYQRALHHMIVSTAGYSVLSYILQIKDRHNGNIMVDGDGYLLHIDFGFIFDISPANNLRFERAGFKLTAEMIELMGGPESNGYAYFVDLVMRGFLAIRYHVDDFVAVVEPMLSSTLSCFRLPTSLQNFRNRFFPDVSDKQAAIAFKRIVDEAYENLRTTVYDWIQDKQQSIYYQRRLEPIKQIED